MSTTTSQQETQATSNRGPVSTRRRVRRALTPLAAGVGAIVAWQLIVMAFGVPTYLVPAPIDVWGAIVENFDTLLTNLWPTALESVLGFVLGNVVAIVTAVVFVHSKPLERAFYPMAVVIRTIPVVAVAPVLVLIFGSGLTPKIVIAALISFFPTLVNMVRGLEAVDKQELELMRVLSASGWEIFWKVRIYTSLPYLFASLKIAATNSVIGAIVAEWIGSDIGLGALIIQATFNFDAPLLYATMVVASLFALLFFYLVGLTERLVVTWEPDTQP